MIYRIRIMRIENGKLVFDRYATDEEMKLLRVNAEGKIEKLKMVSNAWSESEHIWQDVSDTHFVEWGEDVDALRSRIEELEESLHGVERQKDEIEGIMNTLNRAIKELPSYVVDNCMTIEDMTSEMLDEYLSPFFT